MIQDLPHVDTTACFEKLWVWNGTRNSDPAMDEWIVSQFYSWDVHYSICAMQQVYFFNRATGDSLWMHPRKSIFEELCLMLGDIWRDARMGLNPMRSLCLTWERLKQSSSKVFRLALHSQSSVTWKSRHFQRLTFLPFPSRIFFKKCNVGSQTAAWRCHLHPCSTFSRSFFFALQPGYSSQGRCAPATSPKECCRGSRFGLGRSKLQELLKHL